jgi:hypothetical protein
MATLVAKTFYAAHRDRPLFAAKMRFGTNGRDWRPNNFERRVRSIFALSCALRADERNVAWRRSEHYIDGHERKRNADQRKNKAVVRTPAIGFLVPVRVDIGLLE